MRQYLDLMRRIGEEGVFRGDRTGTGTYSIFGPQMEFDLREGFPLVTTKRVFWKGVVHELIWFLRGDTNNQYLNDLNIHIWDDWMLKEDVVEERLLYGHEQRDLLATKLNVTQAVATAMLNQHDRVSAGGAAKFLREHGIPDKETIVRHKKGDLGPVYGSQWRSWRCADGTIVDQIAELVKGLRERPYSRRLLVCSWNVGDLPNEAISPEANVLNGRMALASCHCLFQFYAAPMSLAEREDIYIRRHGQPVFPPTGVLPAAGELEQALDAAGIPVNRLSCKLYQRSADYFLGVPFNIASYALLTMMIAQVVEMEPSKFIWSGGDVHLYSNHMEQADIQLSREPRDLPQVKLNPAIKNLEDFRFEDIELIGYDPHPKIPAPISK